MAVGVGAAVLLLAPHSRLHAVVRGVRSRRFPRPTSHQPFIPDLPIHIHERPGSPADIPRRFLVEEANACLRAGGDVEVVAYVHSAISRVEQRRQTRLTWASADTPKMVVVFMVGRAKTSVEHSILLKESSRYHDIVQGDYGDHYNLLSYKALSSLYWVTRNCAHVPWTLHADDDILVDTFMLQRFIHGLKDSSERNALHCRKMDEEVQRKGKWRVSRYELPASRYPPYCQGAMWLLPTAQIPKLLKASASINFLWVDDAYITGLLAAHANISIHDVGDQIDNTILTSADVGSRLAWVHLRLLQRSQEWPRVLAHHHGPTTSAQPLAGTPPLPLMRKSLATF